MVVGEGLGLPVGRSLCDSYAAPSSLAYKWLAMSTPRVLIPQQTFGVPSEAPQERRMVVGEGFEPPNALREWIYSPRPLATWISYQLNELPNLGNCGRWQRTWSLAKSFF